MTSKTPRQPTQDELAWILATWRIDALAGKVFSLSTGREIGHVHDNRVRLNRPYFVNGVKKTQVYKRAHVVWWVYYGTWPSKEVDHENRNSLDDCIGNLRELTSRANTINTDKSDRDLPVGVYSSCGSQTFHAKAFINGQTRQLGSYASPEAASRAYQTATEKADG